VAFATSETGRGGERDGAIRELRVARIKPLKDLNKRGTQVGNLVLGGGGERGAE
jgi:hypothetical protein